MKQIEWIKVIRDMSPRVHCITNYVTAGDVANMVLAIGGSPIMAQGIREVEDVTSICQSLVLNMGTLEEERVEAMILAGKKAAGLGHPVILDPVGVTASAFRRVSALRILKAVRTGGGTGSFRMYLTDYMSILDDGMLERGKKIEIS